MVAQGVWSMARSLTSDLPRQGLALLAAALVLLGAAPGWQLVAVGVGAIAGLLVASDCARGRCTASGTRSPSRRGGLRLRGAYLPGLCALPSSAAAAPARRPSPRRIFVPRHPWSSVAAMWCCRCCRAAVLVRQRLAGFGRALPPPGCGAAQERFPVIASFPSPPSSAPVLDGVPLTGPAPCSACWRCSCRVFRCWSPRCPTGRPGWPIAAAPVLVAGINAAVVGLLGRCAVRPALVAQAITGWKDPGDRCGLACCW